MRKFLPETDVAIETESKVTILTWPAFTSIRHSALSEGHSALRTYRGGPENKGIYASFWPGDNQWALSCAKQNKNNKEDTSLCHQNVSHFHTADDDDLAYRNFPEVKPNVVDLTGLDIKIINQAFIQKKENSPQWSPQYNCSDLVLELLEKGGLYQKINIRRYGWKTVMALGIFSGFVLLDLIDFFWVLITTRRINYVLDNNDKDFFFLYSYTPSEWILSRLNIFPSKPYFLLACRFFDGLTGGVSTGFLTYYYALCSFLKSNIPKEIIYSFAKRDAFIAGAIAFLSPILYYPYLIRNLLSYLQLKINKNMSNIFFPLTMIAFNILVVALPSFFKYLFDKTTTPRQIYNLLQLVDERSGIKFIKRQEVKENPEEISQTDNFSHNVPISFFNNLYKSKYKILTSTLALCSIGFLAYRNSVDVISGPDAGDIFKKRGLYPSTRFGIARPILISKGAGH